MNTKKHRLSILVAHVGQWMRRDGMSQLRLAAEVVEKFREMGFDEALQVEDIFFMNTDDPYQDAATNRQKLMRWLGLISEGEHVAPDRLFFVEQCIVAAMPVDIRVSYLAEVYEGCGLYFTQAAGSSGEVVDFTAHAKALIKEDGEAELAVIGLSDQSTLEEMRQAAKELRESIASTQQALDQVEAQIERERIA